MSEAKQFAKRLSLDNPHKYVLLTACFGIYAVMYDRLNVFAPSDSCCDSYWRNGRQKQFTPAQKVADQNATPLSR
ncbi:MAG: hypothetical protein ACKJRP_03970 [SAR86 cluster bacterium]